ncbi:MmgE/PrpD family protein [Pigmentiphaga sp. H8]|uniref:MmgE/PrpD family protein n=1 Tax=Pigmentiphaga sp. H8 TaxID=2488560 RepID=UPI000F58FA08|nr:MmgE/PrpD family protein [Pigmentiphaga sp. H8]AZG09640.1 MmgE/PrpD family protein [Pigmentiphaga sp. H8]
MRAVSPNDAFLDHLAAFCIRARRFEIDAVCRDAVRKIVLDSFGVVLGALDHRAAQRARKFAACFPVPEGGARLWGTGERVGIEHAALLNSPPLRAYDFNDFYLGRLGGAHPSDILTGVIAVAESAGAGGLDVARALCLGYEMIVAMSDYIDPDRAGWDYPCLTALGATAAIGGMLELDHAQFRQAFSITVNANYPSLEAESSEFDAHGELTMWKRFNGGDGVRHAIYACYLAKCGVEGVVRPFEGKFGYLAKLQATADEAEQAVRRIQGIERFEGIARGSFKRWPVGSRGQSAIQSALRARAAWREAGRSPDAIARVTVHADPGVYRHLYEIRVDPFAPRTREAADHSLPYIVAAALVQGGISPASFEAPLRESPELRRLLDGRIEVVQAGQASPSNLLSEVVIEDESGHRWSGGREAAPGSAGVPISFDTLVEKFKENLGAGRAARAEALISAVANLDACVDVRKLVDETVA